MEDIGDTGVSRFANFKDSEGNMLSLVQMLADCEDTSAAGAGVQ
jgi:hypothetical protein